MITRIVKMIFKEEHTEEFKEFSSVIKPKIKDHQGCLSLEILQDSVNPKIFFTCSIWEKEEDLERYKQSEFFTEVWPRAKKWFAGKPEAWSLINTENNKHEYDKR